MKAEKQQQKRQLFLASLVVIALVINSKFSFNGHAKSPSQPTPVATVAPQRTLVPEPPKTPAFDPAPFRKQYLLQDTTVSPSSTIAVAVASEKRDSNTKISQAIIRHCQNQGTELTTSFFKQEFFWDRIFDDAFAGSDDVFKKLNLPGSLAGALLARETVTYTTNSALQNMITAEMHLDIVFFQFKGGTHSQTWSFTANGPGFTKSAARSQAEDRILTQIDKASDFSSRSLNIN